jgi:hypothetical protein
METTSLEIAGGLPKLHKPRTVVRASRAERSNVVGVRVKVIDLAKELGVTSKDLIVAMEGMGHKGMRAMSPLLVATANELRVKLGRSRELPAESKPTRVHRGLDSTPLSIPMYEFLSESLRAVPRVYQSCTLCRREFRSWPVHLEYSVKCRQVVESVAAMVASPQWYDDAVTAEREASLLRTQKARHDLYFDRAIRECKASSRRDGSLSPALPRTYWCFMCQDLHEGKPVTFDAASWNKGESQTLKRDILADKMAGHHRPVCQEGFDIILSVTRMIRALQGVDCVVGSSCRTSPFVSNPFHCRCVCVGLYHGQELGL